jgi:hypothetical protein
MLSLFNSFVSRLVATSLAALLMLNLATPALGCGPFFIEPVFVFKWSPDLPFADFTGGKIGIIKPTFGRKTLTIAFRYLNGGSFTRDEQKALATALRGKATEKPDTDPVKTWVETRKGFLAENEKLPAIYVEQRYGGYDFFPNCTPNAFEIATETLKARVASYGADDKNVPSWLAAQDTVFQNCSSAGKFPEQLGKESVEWLRKDRDYQIAAANFYSLNFDQARILFTAISQDPASPWQETADYLVARNWVRQASLTQNEAQRNEIYKQAELYLQALQLRTTTFARATQRLLALVKYRIHPEQRVRELARILAYQNGNENLGQDLIDYVWLVDKFEAETLEEIEKLKNPQKDSEAEEARINRERSEAINTGQTLTITIYPKMKEGMPDYSERVMLGFDKDATEAEVIQSFEIKAGRKLTEDELKQIKDGYASARQYSEYLRSPNRKLDDRGSHERHKGCDYDCERLSLKAIPEVLRADELTDWMLTFQTDDPAAYRHAHAKWRETKSDAWLVVVLAKAQKTSPRLAPALRRAEQIERDSPAFATVAYHLIRLRIAMGQQLQARAMLEDILSWQGEALPISAQNQLLEQRMRLSRTLDEFLQFSGRRPVTFEYDGRLGSILNLMEEAKSDWNPEYYQQTKEEHDREIEKAYESRLPWDFQSNFDDATIDILNWYFPLSMMAEASRNPALPNHLRRRLLLTLWTRAFVLKQPAIAEKIAPEVLKFAPEMAPALQDYLDARTPQERNHAALFVLLKFPNLSPLLRTDLPDFNTVEDQQYYLQDAWWCAPSDTEYNLKGEEVPKIVFKPVFLSAVQVEAARRERASLVAIGDAKSYLGKQTIAWAKSAPQDARVPEALYIAVQANATYKYGCSGWESDELTRKQAETILRTKYPQSPWTAKLTDTEENLSR